MKPIFSSNSRNRRHRQAQPEQQGEDQAFFSKAGQYQQINKPQPFFQAKQEGRGLAVGKPGDHYEREADAVADTVVNHQAGQKPVVQRQKITPVGKAGNLQRLATPDEEKMPSTNDARIEEDKAIQEKPIQKMGGPEEEELLQGKAQEEEEPVQMMAAPEEEELMQAKTEEEEPVQMQTEEEEEPVQMMAAPEEEEMMQAKTQEEEEPVQMQTEEEEEPVQMMAAPEEEEMLQTKSQPGARPATANLSNRLGQRRGSGKPLSKSVKSQMEQSFGVDFSGVNIHTDTEAVQMNQDLSAQAFTHGQDVYFNSGKFKPENTEGKRLLAHELTHVVQQNDSTQIKRKPADIQTVPEERMSRSEFTREIRNLEESGRISAEEAQSYISRVGSMGRRERARIIRQLQQRQAAQPAPATAPSQSPEAEAATAPATPAATTDQDTEAAAAPAQAVALTPRDILNNQIAQFGGVKVALYAASGVKAEGEFRRQAQQFAADHNAIGVDSRGRLVFGTNAAMQMSGSINSRLAALQTAISAELGQSEPVINTLAIFTHGESYSLQAASGGTWIQNYSTWVAALAPYISPNSPRIWLYACSTAADSTRPSRTDTLPFAEATRQALQTELQLLYPDQLITTEVAGHLTARHTTANPDVGIFSGGAENVGIQSLQPTLATYMADSILSISNFQALSPTQKATIRARALREIRRVFHITSADHSTRSPINAYVREIFNFGIDAVWNHFITSGAIDFTALGYSQDANTRLNDGLNIFRGRFTTGYDAVFTLAENEAATSVPQNPQ